MTREGPPNPPDDEVGDETQEALGEGAQGDLERTPGGVGDLVRRALLAGVGAVYMTEEGIRKTVGDMKMPKEAFSYLAGQAEKTRSEAGRILRKEIRRFLNSDAFKQELAKLVSGLTLEIKAEVRLRPDSSGATRPDVDAKVRVKSKPDDEGQG